MTRNSSTTRQASVAHSGGDPFAGLTWDDLDAWAGATIAARGRTYEQRGAVSALARCDDGAVIAWVQGAARYATRIEVKTGGHLHCACTCPYWTTCKHAVAVVLAYLNALTGGATVASARPDDQRVTMLEQDRDWSEDPGGEWLDTPAAAALDAPPLHAFLEQQSHAELVALLERFAAAEPGVHRALLEHSTIASGDLQEILLRAREEIDQLGAVEWHGYTSASTDVDLARLQRYLAVLVDRGAADAVVEVGPSLLEAGAQRIEAEPESESHAEVAACVTLVYRALSHSSLPLAEQLMRAIGLSLSDEYGLCDEALSSLLAEDHPQSAWEAVARRLGVRLERAAVPRGENDYQARYQRDTLSRWVVQALERAGCEAEAITVCEREAELTGDYLPLVDRLMAAERWAEACTWCEKGLADSEARRRPYRALRIKLAEICRHTDDPLRAAAIAADEFFEAPGIETFKALTEAAKAAGVESAVDAWARFYLESGERPPEKTLTRAARRHTKGAPGVPWPLPASGIVRRAGHGATPAPMVDTLIDLAIAERRPDDALRWYEHGAARRASSRDVDHPLSLKVANAVAESEPDRAVAIWKAVAEAHIDTANIRGYEAAARVLRRVHDVLSNAGRGNEWQRYLANLRARNARRRRCIEILDSIERGGRRIVDG